MNNKVFIDSGILEQYVLGTATHEELIEVEKRIAADPAIRKEIETIREVLEKYTMDHAIEPTMLLKPFLMATIDYSERLKKGEPVTSPPLLNDHSKPEDFAPWLNRPDMVSSGNEDLFALIIGYTKEVTTAIVWIKNYAPNEVHDDEFERFLIVEGTCDIIVEEEANHLVPGDYFAIPLYKNHTFKVTSSFPCKVILQRVAA